MVRVSSVFRPWQVAMIIVALAGDHVLAGAAPTRWSRGTETDAQRVPSLTQVGTIDLLYQNDLTSNTPDGALLLHRPVAADQASDACKAIGEELLDASNEKSTSDIVDQLHYLAFEGKIKEGDSFWIKGKEATASEATFSDGQLEATEGESEAPLPVLCTHKAPASVYSSDDKLPKASFYGADKKLSVQDGEYTYTGIRDRRSFRFLGIPFADPPVGNKRFMHSTPYTGQKTIDATNFGDSCMQPSLSGQKPTNFPMSEDCLSLNVFTTTLPSASGDAEAEDVEQPKLKPVFVWIYGGSFRMGRNSKANTDGGNMASRGDVVVVSINYRLGALGFLASGQDIPGNAGISDMNLGLKWVQEHIRAFGGDPEQVTIGGESAGAQAVTALLSSSASKGLYRAAVIQSAPDIPFFTRSVATKVVTPNLTTAFKCPTEGPDMVACLQKVEADKLAYGRKLKDATQKQSEKMADFYNSTKAVPAEEPFIPVADGLIDDQWFYLLGNGTLPNKVPIMVGSLTGEGTAFVESGALIPLPAFDWVMKQALLVYYTPPVSDGIIGSGLFGLVRTDLDTLRDTMDSLVTLSLWSCVTQYQVQSGMESGALGPTYLYEMDSGYPTSPREVPAKCVAEGTGSAACHANDIMVTFGNVNIDRGKASQDFMDYTRSLNDYWTAFVRTLQPNTAPSYLKARGRSYEASMAKSRGEPWEPVSAMDPEQKQFNLYRKGFSMGPYPYVDKCKALYDMDALPFKRINNLFPLDK